MELDKYSSFFSKFDSNYATQTIGVAINQIDTIANIRRNTFVNNTILDLLKYAYQSELLNSKVIFSPNYANILIDFEDTLRITNLFINYNDQNRNRLLSQ